MLRRKTLRVSCLLLLLLCLSVLAKAVLVEPNSGGVKLTCPGKSEIYKDDKERNETQIKYADSNSGKYECKEEGKVKATVYVKFRTCDNCVELDEASISGMIVGDVVATFVIGVSVYLLAKHATGGSATPNKKASDRRHLVSNEVDRDEHYQPLRNRNGQGDLYDKLRK